MTWKLRPVFILWFCWVQCNHFSYVPSTVHMSTEEENRPVTVRALLVVWKWHITMVWNQLTPSLSHASLLYSPAIWNPIFLSPSLYLALPLSAAISLGADLQRDRWHLDRCILNTGFPLYVSGRVNVQLSPTSLDSRGYRVCESCLSNSVISALMHCIVMIPHTYTTHNLQLHVACAWPSIWTKRFDMEWGYRSYMVHAVSPSIQPASHPSNSADKPV